MLYHTFMCQSYDIRKCHHGYLVAREQVHAVNNNTMSFNLAKVMASSLKATEFEWLDNDSVANDKDTDNFRFLNDGYLHMTEEEVDHIPHGIYSTPTRQKDMKHASLVRRTSDPSLKVHNHIHYTTHTYICLSFF